jgi:hypothetical protein
MLQSNIDIFNMPIILRLVSSLSDEKDLIVTIASCQSLSRFDLSMPAVCIPGNPIAVL